MTATPATLDAVRTVLSRCLQLGTRAADLQRESLLLGSLPELDSMAVVQVLGAIEERFDFAIADDDVSAEHFATLGALADFVQGKLAG